VTQSEEGNAAARCWASGARASQAAGKEMDCRAESEGNEDFHFLFPFQLFQMILKPNLNLNQTTQFKLSNEAA
jgi:hypothetical protein